MKQKTNNMKSIYISLLLVCSTLMIHAQESLPYIFSVEQEAYQPLENPSSLTFNAIWDDPAFTVFIPFDFHYMGDTITSLNTTEDLLGGVLFAGIPDITATDLIVAHFSDLIDLGFREGKSLSSINSEITGEEPNRIVKIEWKNAGFYNEVADTSFTIQSFVNFQAWFYESTNDIEYRFGPSFIASPLVHDVGGVSCALADDLNLGTGFIKFFWALQGDPANPSVNEGVDIDINAQDPPFLNSDPSDGTVYRFSSLVTSTDEIVKDLKGVKIFPSLANEVLYLENTLAKNLQYRIVNQSGFLMSEGNTSSSQEEIDISSLSAGNYFMILSEENRIATKKFIKVN